LTPALAEHSELKNLSRRVQSQPPRQADVTVRHEWPPKWDRPAAGAWVLIQPWEFGALPAEWTQRLAAVDEIWAPSDYVRRVYIESGVHPSKVKIVPNGIDPQKFRLDVESLKLATNKKFKFLFVGGTIQRKGPDILLQSYLKTFTAADDVCLVIKDFGGQSVYQGQTFAKEILAAQMAPDAPEILYLTNEFAAEEIPGLYAACQCLLHPYRGEGFGLPVLEAMACGLPVVVTGGGATDDFATDEFAYRIPALKKLIGDTVGGMKLHTNGWWLEPDAAAFADRMKWIFANHESARKVGLAASAHVRANWTWARAAQIAERRLQDLTARKHAQAAAVAERRARKAGPMALPESAKVGYLGAARESLARKDFIAAWNSALAALAARPFHCEAYLLLAEIAKAAGDVAQAKICAERARQLAPDWKPARQFIKGLSPNGRAREWPALPAVVKPRLSVCLITRNEERFLGKCLQSIRELAHQIVVVDTGSTDATVEIAHQFQAEVHRFPWNDDFSAARNEALKYATGDWVLCLDADEELLPQHLDTLRQEMLDASVMAYRLPIIDAGREQEGCSYVPRLFRNAPGLFFVGRVHEQVFTSILVRAEEWSLKNVLGKSTLFHHGYTKELIVSRDKIARNLRLLELAMEELPNEPNLLMSYGMELARSGQLQAGLEHYIEALHLISNLPPSQVVPELRETLLTQLSTHLMAAKAFNEIVRLWNSAFAKSAGMTASQHFILGLAYMELKQFAEAAEQMRHCLAKRNQPVLSPINREIVKAGPSHCLAICLSTLGQKAAAEQAFHAALKDDPTSRAARFDFAKFQVQKDQPVEALKLLTALVQEKTDEVQPWELGGQIALSQPGFIEFARDWTGEAIKHFPKIPAIALQRAEFLLLSQQVDDALPLWARAHSAKSARHLAALALCEFVAGGCERQFRPADEKIVSQEFLKWYRQLINSGATSVVNQINERLDDLKICLPTAATTLHTALKKAGEALVA
jgi:glycosyltransferase involved in cell wall biosynthesis